MSARCTATATYRRHEPKYTALYRTIEAHLETFLAETAEGVERSGLPVFVKWEVPAYLRCGILDHGFARVRCARCAYEHLVPFSCKRRGYAE